MVGRLGRASTAIYRIDRFRIRLLQRASALLARAPRQIV